VTDALLKFQLEADLAEAVEAIHADAAAGPIEVARRGAQVALRLTEKAHYERPLQINLEVQGLARALLEARPDSMPLANLASLTASPLPELYGRGKEEGARMRADLRTRISEWLSALEDRALRIDGLRVALGPVTVVTAHAVDGDSVFFLPGRSLGARPRYAVAGVEKFVPPNYQFDTGGLQRVPVEEWEGILTGDADTPATAESVRKSIASLRFETALL
jgi:hypothetical protein